jgi:membrane associated rhomboid family serine protease
VTTPTSNVFVCYRHPDRRAGVTCQRCDRPICPDCMNAASVGFHCPECARSGKQKVYTRANLQALNRPVLTQILIAINVSVWLLGLANSARSPIIGQNGGFIIDGGLYGPAVAAGDWYRIFTSGFLHAGLIHLGLNMYLLYLLGGLLEPSLGRIRFGAVYFASLLCGSFGVLLLSPNSLTVGASGAVFGLMGALFLNFRQRGIDPWASGIGPTIAINLAITFVFSANISIGGHVFGLAGGLASAWILFHAGPRIGEKQATLAVFLLGAIAFAGGLLIV